jgi:hypothetical protein
MTQSLIAAMVIIFYSLVLWWQHPFEERVENRLEMCLVGVDLLGCATSLYVTVFKKESAAPGQTDFLLGSLTYINLAMMIVFLSHAVVGFAEVCFQKCKKNGVCGLMAPGFARLLRTSMHLSTALDDRDHDFCLKAVMESRHGSRKKFAGPTHHILDYRQLRLARGIIRRWKQRLAVAAFNAWKDLVKRRKLVRHVAKLVMARHSASIHLPILPEVNRWAYGMLLDLSKDRSTAAAIRIQAWLKGTWARRLIHQHGADGFLDPERRTKIDVRTQRKHRQVPISPGQVLPYSVLYQYGLSSGLADATCSEAMASLYGRRGCTRRDARARSRRRLRC